MNEPPLETLVRTVSASPQEYLQGLQQAVPGGVSGGPLQVQLIDGPVSISIGIEVQPDYVIALMRLPSLIATWQFTSGTDAERKACLARIDWSMKRGGG